MVLGKMSRRMIILKQIKFENGSTMQSIEPRTPCVRSKGFFYCFTKFGWLDFSNIPKDMIGIALYVIENIEIIDIREDDNTEQNKKE